MAERAPRISEQERRNVWLSVYSATVMGLVSTTKKFDDENEKLRQIANDLADGGLTDYEDTFGDDAARQEEPDDEGEEEEEEDEEEEEREPRRRSGSRRS